MAIGTVLETTAEPTRRRKLGDFLKTKRASRTPDAFGLPLHRRRRVSGLRREELAMLAGISVTWYTQLESGAKINVSPALIGRLASILELTPLERTYLFTLTFDELGAVDAVLPELGVISARRIAAETFQGEIALVLRAHRTLKTQIYSGLLHGTIDALQPQLDETRCPIGLWLHDDLAPRQRVCTHYSRAARIHVAFHREIDKVVSVAQSGVTANIERLLATQSRYVVASQALERAFSVWGS